MSASAKADYRTAPPLSKCAICGHIRADHDTLDRERCGRCWQREANHLFEPLSANDGTDAV